jgi:septum formation protein
MPTLPRLILGSQSPRRRELLGWLLPGDDVEVVSPRITTEPSFADDLDLAQIDAHLLDVARLKNADVREQAVGPRQGIPVLTADTVVVVFDERQRPLVLGKPPDNPREQGRVVREWFDRYYLGKVHLAKTGVCLTTATGRHEALVTTQVWFRGGLVEAVPWYVSTGEPAGKAGGYAIQGAGSLFVERIEGSLSNVVGLPLAETRELLIEAGIHAG